jgi:hypothetical protein
MDKKIALENLVILRDILDFYSTDWFLTDGTLLGYYREGDFIGHDTDTDIGIFMNTFNKKCIYDIVKEFKIEHIFGMPESSLEIALRRLGVKTDLFFFYEKDDLVYHSAFMNFSAAGYTRLDFPYKKFGTKWISWKDNTFKVPQNELDFITTKYGDNWETPEKNWHWGISPKNVIDTRYWIYTTESHKAFNDWLKQ